MIDKKPILKNSFIAFLLTVAMAPLSAQEECPPSDILNPNKTWTEYISAYIFNSIRLKFDSIPIEQDGKVYFELLKSNSESSDDWESNGLFRFDNGRLYHKGYAGSDLLWYDFNLVEGDTFHYEGDPYYEYVVLKVDTIIFEDGSLRKRWNLKPTDEDYWRPTTWVEGIGNTAGFDQNRFPWTFDNEVYTLTCVYCHGGIIYDNADFDSCWIVRTVTEELKHSEVKIVPNPTRDEILIRGIEGQIKSVQIYNAMGVLVKVETEFQTRTDNLSNGYYTAVVVLANGSSRALRFVKI